METSGGMLVLDSLRTPPMSFNQLQSVGIMDLSSTEIFVAKGSVAPRAAYEPVSARIIEVDSAAGDVDQPAAGGLSAGAEGALRVDTTARRQ